jgi:[ribosomal protein S18]-alanine N-acetyltransferase
VTIATLVEVTAAMAGRNASIESATAGDLDAVLALERDGFGSTEQWSRSSWQSELESSSTAVLVARDDDHVLGVIALRIGPDSCDLDRIVVASTVRRHGLGRDLLTAGLRLAASRGVREMILEVSPDNRSAVALYGSFGFQQLTVRSNYYGPGQHAMIMSRPVRKDDDE